MQQFIHTFKHVNAVALGLLQHLVVQMVYALVSQM